jgi:hypothetical protein
MDNYLLLVHLTNSRDPVITRLISVPSKFTFATLHEVLQVAFGWANCHEHSFAVSKLLEKGEVSPSKSSRILLSIVKGSSGVDDPAGDYFNKSTSKLT